MTTLQSFKQRVIDNLENDWSSDNTSLNSEAADIARQDSSSEWNQNLVDFGDTLQGVHECAEFYRDCILNGA